MQWMLKYNNMSYPVYKEGFVKANKIQAGQQRAGKVARVQAQG